MTWLHVQSHHVSRACRLSCGLNTSYTQAIGSSFAAVLADKRSNDEALAAEWRELEVCEGSDAVVLMHIAGMVVLGSVAWHFAVREGVVEFWQTRDPRNSEFLWSIVLI